jgi:hypothetical protein
MYSAVGRARERQEAERRTNPKSHHMIICTILFILVHTQTVPANEFAVLSQVVTAYGCFQASDPCKLNGLNASDACSIYTGDFGLFCDDKGYVVSWNPPGNPGGYISTEVVEICLTNDGYA